MQFFLYFPANNIEVAIAGFKPTACQVEWRLAEMWADSDT